MLDLPPAEPIPKVKMKTVLYDDDSGEVASVTEFTIRNDEVQRAFAACIASTVVAGDVGRELLIMAHAVGEIAERTSYLIFDDEHMDFVNAARTLVIAFDKYDRKE